MICICIPSRGRPKYTHQTVTQILSMAQDPQQVIVKYYLNDDDPELAKYITALETLKTKWHDSVQWTVGPDQSPVYSWNLLAESTEADYYMLAGDEIEFKTRHWDTMICDCKKKYPDGIFVIATYDGRGPHTIGRCTQPFVTKEWADALGYFWHPALFHWNVDEYTGELCQSINRFIYLKDILIKCTKIKDRTGNRLRKQGLMNRDQWVFDKMINTYFETDKQRLLEKCNADQT